ncbi:MAG: hypothetical protein ACO39Q_09515, partial [Ilumatobacteraceae bacterium]
AARRPATGTTPTATPPGPPSRAVIAALEEGTVMASSESAGPTLIAGSEVDVRVGGFNPGEEVQILVASTPRLLGTVRADDDGYIAVRVSLPSDLAQGQHTLAVVSRESGRGIRQAVTVAAGDESPQLPVSGTRISVWPLLLIAVGMAALAVRRTGRTSD